MSVTIASDEKEDGNYSMQINFRDGRSVLTEVEKDEIQRVVKRVKDFTKRMTKLETSGLTDVETDAETDVTTTGKTASNAVGGKKKKESSASKNADGPITAASSS